VAGAVRRAGWGLLDQVLSSATNFGLTFFVAASVAVAEFGAFSLAYVVYGVALGLSSGLASAPLVVRFSAAAPAEVREAERSSVSAALVTGLLGGAACLVAGLVLDGALRSTLLALAPLLPGLLVQDAWRFAFVARGEPARAAGNDLLWLVLQVGGVVVLLALDAVSAPAMVLVWGGAATVAALVACVQARARPTLAGARSWLREQRDLGARYALEHVAMRSGPWLAVGAVGVVAGLSAVAALHGMLLLVLGPLNLLFLAASFVAVPEGVRLFRQDPERLPRAAGLSSLVVTALAAGWCGVLVIGGDRVGGLLLGETWGLAEPLLPVFVLLALARAASLGPGQGLRAVGDARRTLWLQLATVAGSVVAAVLGAVAAGAGGAATGLMIVTVLTTTLRWWQFRRAFAEAMALP
jgi:O-antigen/teichoic acid export membrane protein